MKNRGYITCAALAAAIGFGGGYGLFRITNNDKLETAERLSAFTTMEKFLADNGNVEITDERRAIEDAVNAYYAYSGDKYLKYYGDYYTTQWEKIINNSNMAQDNGFEVACDVSGCLLMKNVEEGSYAYDQGLRTNDLVIEINGIDIAETGFQMAAGKILGKNGTTAEIVLIRDGKTINVTYNRKFKVEDNETYELIGNICYINFRDEFSIYTDGVVRDAISECGDNAIAYIIDLRENGGGELNIAVSMADLFVGKNDIVTKQGYDGTTEVLSTTDGGEIEKPVVLLVNENSASASEVFTAVMKQFYSDTTIVGTNTFGKGIYQLCEEYDSGEAIYYTAGYYTVGDWECYQGVGIAPDVEVEMDNSLIGTSEDIQLAKALKLLGRAK